MAGKQSALQIILEDRKQLVDAIIKNMENGYILTGSAWNKAALSPQNPVSGVYYKGANKLKLMNAVIVNGYTDPRWMTAIQIRDAGYRLSDAAKGNGVICEKWIFTKEVKEVDPDTGEKKKVIVKLDKPRVSYFRVFNAELVVGVPQYIPKKPIDDILTVTDHFIDTSECEVKEVAQERAFYSLNEDIVTLPLRETFKDSESFFSVTIHVMGHSTGHPSRLDRTFGFMGDENYAKEELRAELSSFFICNDIGIVNNNDVLQDHTNYLKSWIKVLKEDPNELFRACKDADQVSERLLDNYAKKYELDRSINRIPQMDKVKKSNKAI